MMNVITRIEQLGVMILLVLLMVWSITSYHGGYMIFGVLVSYCMYGIPATFARYSGISTLGIDSVDRVGRNFDIFFAAWALAVGWNVQFVSDWQHIVVLWSTLALAVTAMFIALLLIQRKISQEFLEKLFADN